MPHRKRAVAKEARGSRRALNKKAGRRFTHLYEHLNVDGPRARAASIPEGAGKQ